MSTSDRDAIWSVHGRFIVNLARAEHLVDAAGRLPNPVVDGLDVREDLIRAAVVFAHATLEDLLRSLVELRLPAGPSEALDGIPLVGSDGEPISGVDASDLCRHRGKTVSELIRTSVVVHLSSTTYNNVEQVARALNQIGVERRLIGEHGSNLAAMMKRRHHIAHRADRNDGEEGAGICRPIDATAVSAWLESLNKFGQAVLERVSQAADVPESSS